MTFFFQIRVIFKRQKQQWPIVCVCNKTYLVDQQFQIGLAAIRWAVGPGLAVNVRMRQESDDNDKGRWQ